MAALPKIDEQADTSRGGPATAEKKAIIQSECHFNFDRVLPELLPTLYATAYSVLRNFRMPGAGELSQDAVQIWCTQFVQSGLANYDPTRPIGPYARQGVRYIAINLALAEQRRFRMNAECADLAELVAGHRKFVETNESTFDLYAAIQALPTNLKEVILLRFWENLKLEDIAKRLHFSAATAHRRLRMAIKQLHASIIAQVESDPGNTKGVSGISKEP